MSALGHETEGKRLCRRTVVVADDGAVLEAAALDGGPRGVVPAERRSGRQAVLRDEAVADDAAVHPEADAAAGAGVDGRGVVVGDDAAVGKGIGAGLVEAGTGGRARVAIVVHHAVQHRAVDAVDAGSLGRVVDGVVVCHAAVAEGAAAVDIDAGGRVVHAPPHDRDAGEAGGPVVDVDGAALRLGVDLDVVPVAGDALDDDALGEGQGAAGERVRTVAEHNRRAGDGRADRVVDRRGGRRPRGVGLLRILRARDNVKRRRIDGEVVGPGRAESGAVRRAERRGGDTRGGEVRGDDGLAGTGFIGGAVAVEIPVVDDALGAARWMRCERGVEGIEARVDVGREGAGESGRGVLPRADVDRAVRNPRLAVEVGRGPHPGGIRAGVDQRRAGEEDIQAVLLDVAARGVGDAAVDAVDGRGEAMGEGAGVAGPVGDDGCAVAVAADDAVGDRAARAVEADDQGLLDAEVEIVVHGAVLDPAALDGDAGREGGCGGGCSRKVVAGDHAVADDAAVHPEARAGAIGGVRGRRDVVGDDAAVGERGRSGLEQTETARGSTGAVVSIDHAAEERAVDIVDAGAMHAVVYRVVRRDTAVGQRPAVENIDTGAGVVATPVLHGQVPEGRGGIVDLDGATAAGGVEHHVLPVAGDAPDRHGLGQRQRAGERVRAVAEHDRRAGRGGGEGVVDRRGGRRPRRVGALRIGRVPDDVEDRRPYNEVPRPRRR